MTFLIALTVGLLAGTATTLIVAGIRRNPVLPRPTQTAATSPDDPREQLAWSAAVLAGAAVVYVVTGWLVAATAAGVGVWSVRRAVRARGSGVTEHGRVEAVAVWTELIRDNMAAAAGIEQALVASAAHAPAAISPEVRQFAARLDHVPLIDALAGLGEDLDMPSSDLVVVALSNAVRLQARDLGPLLSRLAVFVRADVRMRLRVEVGRARIRTSARIVLGTTLVTGLFLVVFSPNLVAAYDTAAGQAWLVVVFATFTAGAVMLRSFARLELPARFSARTTTTGPARIPAADGTGGGW